jgi:hypothetical protein
MKKQSYISLIALALIALLSSCAMHQGYIVSSAALSSNNFIYVKDGVKGTATATYVFGMGGLSKEGLVDAAKQDMLSTNPLRDNQALVNLTVNWKKSFVLPFAITHRCTITGDIVEFR